MPSSRRAPRRAGFRGRDKSRPYGQILCFRQTEQPRCLPRFAGEGHGPPAGVRGRAGRADMESAPTWGVCGGGNVPGFESSTVRRRERPPYGAGETRRPTGKMQFPAAIANPCRGRCSHRPGVFAAAQGSAGGINPAPTGKFCVSGKPGTAMFAPVCRGPRPSRRSAARQGIWNRPLHGVFAAARGSRDDASIVPYIPLQLCNPVFPPDADIVDGRRGGFHIRPVYGGAGFRGRDKSRPYEQILHLGAAKTPPHS